MNYLNGELNYNFSLAKPYGLFSDGSAYEYTTISGNYSVREYIKQIVNASNSGYYADMVYLPTSQYNGYLFFNVRMDYIVFKPSSYQVTFSLYKFDETQNVNALTAVASSTYATPVNNQGQVVNQTSGFNTLEYRQYSTSYQNDNNSMSVFDLSLMQYYFNDIQYTNLEGHVFNYLDSRPDNSLFYNYCLYVSGYRIDDMNLNIMYASDTTGSATYKSWQEAYDTGYQAGETNGYGNGFADGYNSNLDGHTVDAFGYIGQAFTAVNSVLAIQILPNVTLGLVFSIPMVFTLILLTFKLVKK